MGGLDALELQLGTHDNSAMEKTMSRRGSCIEWTLASSVVLFVTLFFTANAALATGPNNPQCTQRTMVAKSVIVAALSGADTRASIVAPADRNLPAGNLIEKQTVAPRSEWIRVAPLRNCCGGYTCDYARVHCVCKRWC
jgi:hypothetical protein